MVIIGMFNFTSLPCGQSSKYSLSMNGTKNEYKGTRENFYKRNESVLDSQKPMVIPANYQ